MSCDEARKLLSDRLDRPLTTEQSAQLRAHLATCAACRDFERALNDSMAGIGLLPRSMPSERVCDSVSNYVALHPEYGEGRHHGWLRQAAGLSAAAIVLVAVSALLIVLLRGQTSGPPKTPPIASQSTATNRVMSAPAKKQSETPEANIALSGTPVANGAQQTPVPSVQALSPTPASTGTAQPSTTATSTSPTPAPSPSTTSTVTPPVFTAAQAQQTVEDYFNAINQQDYAAAWSLFSDQMKASQGAPTLKAFASGYAGTDHDVVHVIQNSPNASTGNYDVLVQVAAYQTDGTIKWFSGTYTVGDAGSQPLIVSANVQPYQSATTTQGDSSLPSCTSSQLGSPQVRVGSSPSNYGGYTIYLSNTGASCQLSTTLTVTVADANQNLLWVFGNSQPQSLVITIPPGGVQQMFTWSNWCATPASATIRVKIGSQAVATFDNQSTPSCTDVHSPTTIGIGPLTKNSGAVWSGTVASIDSGDGRISLTMTDGSVRSVSVSSKTRIEDPSGGPASIAAIQPGDSLTAKGVIAADGTTLIASTISLGSPPSSGAASPSPTPTS